MSIGDRLKAARKAAGLTQQELADRCGIAQGMISQWETGKQQPTQENLDKAAEILGPLTESSTTKATEFGVWLRSIRESKGMTPNELANKAKISLAQIYNLESGRTSNPQEKTKKHLQEALGSDVPREVNEETAREATIQGIGQLVGFDPYEEAELQDVPGVYVFYDISDRPVYVGKASSIRERVRQHYQKFWFKRPIVDTASYIEVRDETLRHQIEQILIKFLKSNAVLNKQSVERE